MSMKFPLNPGGGKGDARRPGYRAVGPYGPVYDMGSIGCKRGCHTFYTDKCSYCNKTKAQIEAAETEANNAREAEQRGKPEQESGC